eukprot:6011148-Alexandrium_andersonii.AAC.1
MSASLVGSEMCIRYRDISLQVLRKFVQPWLNKFLKPGSRQAKTEQGTFCTIAVEPFMPTDQGIEFDDNPEQEVEKPAEQEVEQPEDPFPTEAIEIQGPNQEDLQG